MSRRAVIIDTEQEVPRPRRHPEPEWWRYVPGIFLRRPRARRIAEHQRRIDKWEAAGRKAAIRYYFPSAEIQQDGNEATITVHVMDYSPAIRNLYFGKETG